MAKKKNEHGKILVAGSVAFDVVFELTSRIRDQVNIKNGKAARQIMMFTAKAKEEFRGGTAGNITYGLSLLGAKPILFSVAGKDFSGEYGTHLTALGVDVRVYIDKEGFTATYYGMTDHLGDQVGVWQPNTYGEHAGRVALGTVLDKNESEKIDVAIFAAGTPDSTISHMEQLRTLNKRAKIIFDPGQSLAALYNRAKFGHALNLCDIFIGNDVEVRYAKKYLNFNFKDALTKGKTVIETRGESGSVIHEKNGIEKIPADKPKKVVDTTGAGDAYRSGLLFGLSRGLGLVESAKIGSKVAAKCIEFVGAQQYLLTNFKK
ncbi:MAG: hypothetical protein A3G52_00080 [Candidatus Taylorbacteria bacterium RIFCSPLOWO2_12_FULL_43_20]|uniref:Carbohydrate kinase PfkB domain-containing protein n=1 Tax=Candidatus Taylorbacteria bacterium RIFCSPLOWO2_12_FULL_43_20 TaxID=1802332 RepID=A0A1G2P2P4_9BACT|nr:MAG: hypothetical protein A2825_03135 [Candidatus Taylorbacteria bacterium RIFCSPHIGHO2_01_FULL_43_120]OHA22958.1 MAG: hypothetical protein A3B98_02870 [Candidatus Taylorbacteria bacterium RIFCSPHIGHO2_02_FULL_43_55]OHA30197.1 MAG: hypothetical protein A3E92_01235 [Candidatus Taylorbacteria bacterium RIFCSPHIGHO2_12_FULL_42_34]OHA31944.1 MAG: hypothetical protein A3B09_00990 [Candidatus Taylorbacteria bacterium RIFCSPLOWO2_01_FULL_43_83]OHA37967.1 MAG: hypothetical protein A3H58_01405 [Candi